MNACCENVLRIWRDGAEERLTQLVFCDLSTPKGDGSFNVYDDLRRKLVARGVPEGEVAFIHDTDTEAKKLALFGKVNAGAVRILMGSTQKMGAGTNVQRRLAAIHDLDCPWRPADLQQRLGRIERQGNMNAEVEAYRYVTEGTFDAYLYQLVEGKQRFIAQVMTSKSPVRTAADVDEAALSYAELKALATGNPLVKERMGLDVEVSRLRMLKADHLAQKYALEDKAAKDYPQRMASLSARLESLEADVAKARANPPPTKEAFSMEVRGTAFRERAAAGEAVLAARGEMTETGAMPLGSYRGFSLELTFDRMSAAFEMRIVGEAEHKCELGGDAAGAVTRLDNAIAKMGAEADECRARLEEARRQMEAARTEATKPFPHEGELKEKSARLAELDALLDVGKSGPEQLCDDGHEPERAERKRSSNGEGAHRAARDAPHRRQTGIGRWSALAATPGHSFSRRGNVYESARTVQRNALHRRGVRKAGPRGVLGGVGRIAARRPPRRHRVPESAGRPARIRPARRGVGVAGLRHVLHGGHIAPQAQERQHRQPGPRERLRAQMRPGGSGDAPPHPRSEAGALLHREPARGPAQAGHDGGHPPPHRHLLPIRREGHEADRHIHERLRPAILPAVPQRGACHESAPRGSKSGTQGLANARERGRIPERLCLHIVDVCEREVPIRKAAGLCR